MNVTAIITIGNLETAIRGRSDFLDGKPGDSLETKGLGFWLYDYKLDGSNPRKTRRAFIPWTSCLYLEEMKNERDRGILRV